MSKPEFNVALFYKALDSARVARRLNWKQVAEASGVSASTLSRLAQGKRPDVDSLAALLGWAGLSGDTFVAGKAPLGSPEPLSQITSVLYADQSLPEEGREAMIDMITAAYVRLRKTGRE
ncbi:MAG: helix-turn-helix domain-containing protein [Hyphomonadaceae bacterium]